MMQATYVLVARLYQPVTPPARKLLDQLGPPSWPHERSLGSGIISVHVHLPSSIQSVAAQSRQSSDDELRRRIVNFLFERNLPGLRRLDVEVRDGEAVIIGFVRTYYEKQLATHCCQRVAGVLRVINDISVFQSDPVSPAPENPPGNAQPRPAETEKNLT